MPTQQKIDKVAEIQEVIENSSAMWLVDPWRSHREADAGAASFAARSRR